MPSHGVKELISWEPHQKDPSKGKAKLLLNCGCTVVHDLAEERLVEAKDGRKFVAGKYRCPLGHGPSDPF